LTRLAAYSGMSKDCLAIYLPNFLLKAGVSEGPLLSDTVRSLSGREDMVCHSQQGLLHGSHENEKGSGQAAVKCVRSVFVFEKRYFSAAMWTA